MIAGTARATAAWLQIAERYGFTENTTVWDVIVSSPLLDEIELFRNAWEINRAYYQRRYGSYASDQNIPYYGSLAAEGSFERRWRWSVPGYGDADWSVTGALHQVLHALISAKYRGRIPLGRDPLPQERWPRSLIFCTTVEAAELLAGTALSRDRTVYNYLFIAPG
jgi:hypothetical protein